MRKIIEIDKKGITIIKSSNYDNTRETGGIGYIAKIKDRKIQDVEDEGIIDLSCDLWHQYLPEEKKELIILRNFLSEVIENIKE